MGSQSTKHKARMKELKKIHALQRQLKAVKAMPNNFRDANISGAMWQELLKVASTEAQQSMEQWARGPILYCHPLTNAERIILGGSDRLYRSFSVNNDFDDEDNTTHFDARLYVPTFDDLYNLHLEATSYRVSCGDKPIVCDTLIPFSFIYVKNITLPTLAGLNILASQSQMTYRWKQELCDKNGVTPGISNIGDR